MNSQQYPTPWQRKTLWSALTAVAVVTIGAIFVGIIWLASRALDILQPILVPFAIAAVMAYLLEPLVQKIVAWGVSRQKAVWMVFGVVSLVLAGMLVWIIPALSAQSLNLARKVPRYTQEASARMGQFSNYLREKYGVSLLPPKSVEQAPDAPASARTTPVEAATSGTADILPPDTGEETSAQPEFALQDIISGEWLQATFRQAIAHVGRFVRESLGGFLGVIGFLVSLIIVPIYLYYFLTEAPNIERSWSDYVPLRASAFKDEVVSALREINGYLIAFFRGQLVVSFINGSTTGLGLVIAGLEFGLLIGLALCLFGIIPYLGITMCWIVAVVIALVQGGSWCVPAHSWWVFPLVISGIFVVVHHIDGLFITPKIVGDSVGLHPLTVIVSVFAWSVLMGGLLGAILAVPMTATLKVLLRRYVWERRFRTPEAPSAPTVPLAPPAALAQTLAPTPAPVQPAAPQTEPLISPEPISAKTVTTFTP